MLQMTRFKLVWGKQRSTESHIYTNHNISLSSHGCDWTCDVMWTLFCNRIRDVIACSLYLRLR